MPGRSKKHDGPGGRLYESVGVLHIHSVYSDGTGTIPQIASHAARHRLEWVIITDHSNIEAKDRGEERRYGSVWVLVGCELGDENKPNHYLAFGINETPNQDDPVTYVKDVHEMGGFGAIAHPHERRELSGGIPPYPWTAWEAEFDGIEIWNQLSQWVEGLGRWNRLHRFMHPLKCLTWPDPETLSVWDRFNRKRRMIGYVGVDAHALKYPLLSGLIHVKVFHYKVQFRSLRTHLILEKPLDRKDFLKAEEQILTALRNGRHYGANHRVGKADGFRFHAVVDGQRVLPADRIDPGGQIEFVAHAPLEADLVLLCDGREIIKARGRTLRYTTREQGVWRLEAHRRGRGWIYSNPIRVLPEDNPY